MTQGVFQHTFKCVPTVTCLMLCHFYQVFYDGSLWSPFLFFFFIFLSQYKYVSPVSAAEDRLGFPFWLSLSFKTMSLEGS